MAKYNQLFKQQVVNFYFEHHEDLAFTLKHFNLAAKTVRYWIAQYKYSGTHSPTFESALSVRNTFAYSEISTKYLLLSSPIQT